MSTIRQNWFQGALTTTGRTAKFLIEQSMMATLAALVVADAGLFFMPGPTRLLIHDLENSLQEQIQKTLPLSAEDFLDKSRSCAANLDEFGHFYTDDTPGQRTMTINVKNNGVYCSRKEFSDPVVVPNLNTLVIGTCYYAARDTSLGTVALSEIKTSDGSDIVRLDYGYLPSAANNYELHAKLITYAPQFDTILSQTSINSNNREATPGAPIPPDAMTLLRSASSLDCSF